MDCILAIAPPKMQRMPSNSSVLKKADRVLDPGDFQKGEFSIVVLDRADVWDPQRVPDMDAEQLECESTWEIVSARKYNLDDIVAERTANV